MNDILSYLVGLVFVLIAAWHFFMALFSPGGSGSTVPSVDGRPVFVPTRRATLAVGFVLILFALLVLATAGVLQPGISRRVLSWLCYALALGLLGRAIGEFRYVGFFKRVHGSRFARLDSWVYSPLCLLLAAAVARVAYLHAA